MPKSKLETLFWLQLTALDALMPEPEFQFHPVRRWRVDFAWPHVRLAVEIEGGVWTGGRHTRGAGFVADIEKYNALVLMDWRLLRFDGAAVRNGSAVKQVLEALQAFAATAK